MKWNEWWTKLMNKRKLNNFYEATTINRTLQKIQMMMDYIVIQIVSQMAFKINCIPILDLTFKNKWINYFWNFVRMDVGVNEWMRVNGNLLYGALELFFCWGDQFMIFDLTRMDKLPLFTSLYVCYVFVTVTRAPAGFFFEHLNSRK